MTQFFFGPLVPRPSDAVVSAALGVNSSGKFSDADIGKAVKLAANNNYVLCSEGDEIEGVVDSIEPFMVNNGFSFGSVQVKDRIVCSNGGAGAITVGTYVVADAQPALGTTITVLSTGTQSGVRPTPVKERTAFDPEAPVTYAFQWRVISLLGGNGGVGTTILCERV